MTLARRARLIGMAAAFATTVSLAGASAQEISDSHLKAARNAIESINATDQFDGILPQGAQALKTELIRKNPDLVDLISTTVDEETIALVKRRADLEEEAAKAYARVFSEDELKAITDFYQSPAGQKLLKDGPIAMREVAKVGQIWQRGIARDLAQNVAEKIEAAADAKVDMGNATDAAASGTATQGGDASGAAGTAPQPAE